MAKTMTIVAVLAVLIAGAVLLWVVLHHGPAPAPSPVVASVGAAASSAPSAVAPAPRPAVAVHPPMLPSPAAPPVSSAAVAAPPKSDLAARIKNLTSEQEAALLKAAEDRDRARRVKEGRYLMPTDRYLMSLKMDFSDAQKLQLQALKDAMKPRLDAALSTIWSQIEELNKQETALLGSVTPAGQSDPNFQAQAKLLYEQLRVANDQENAISSQLDQDYQAQVQAIMTPEQLKTYNMAVGAMMHNFSPAPKR